jgi:dihydrofolate reductase
MTESLMLNKKLILIAAMSENRVIGINNRLPWNMPADLLHFRKLTAAKPFIMGRNSYISEDALLSDYKSVILSHEEIRLKENCFRAASFSEAIEILNKEDDIFILGGEQVFRDTILLASYIYLTVIHTVMAGDAFFPDIDPFKWRMESSQFNRHDELNPYDYSFVVYARKD